ncbi:Holliday junction branch migration protein RuvA [Paramicrobacterium chengjingii]|uniref:Holliday junction branch migration complex subunit RuvA n=1 Tax=Paramicrobacterium chengjingii TaxID=2769067 RepID=A0ABX6YMV1_9MICO|nr:Holliday junction branch migration protein RuvA [Microbacterium chengjingii]QPZ40015.1 Holliday junction branch migration protein RuvA [Microbacterium chengjingii]
MISSVRGTVLSARGGNVIIEVGGVGLAVQVTPEHELALRTGETAFIHTSLIVREDALSLFGFETSEQLEIFELLLRVNGVGPKSALGVLSALGPGQVATAVESEDDKAFRAVSGIGPKTAKLIILSLAGKVTSLAYTTDTVAPKQGNGADVVVALTGLGWSERDAESALSSLLSAQPDLASAPVQTLLRLALAQLGPSTSKGGQR